MLDGDTARRYSWYSVTVRHSVVMVQLAIRREAGVDGTLKAAGRKAHALLGGYMSMFCMSTPSRSTETESAGQ